MKLSLTGLSVVAILACSLSVQAAGKDLLLLTTPDADAKLATRVQQFCSTELYSLAVQVKPLKKDADSAWPVLSKVLASTLGKDDLAAVLLSSSAVNSNTITLSSNAPVAVVNLKDPRKDGKADDELYARWIERESMRAYGLLLGVKTCPNPQCAMSDYKVKPESLSELGRNYCPYCKKCLGEQLKAKGIVIPEPKRVRKVGP